MADLTVGELVAYASVDNKSFDSGLSHIERGLKAVTGSATASTGRMEKTVASGFDRMLHDVQSTLGDVAREAGKSGQASGTAFTQSLDSALDGVDAVAGRAGRDAGTSFIDEAREVLRYGELDADIDADITAALAALAELETAAEQSGQRAGDRFVRGADGRLRDARGRFVAQGKTLFDGLAEGAESSGSLMGKGFGEALGSAVRASANPALLAALGGVAVTAGPAIGAAMGGAIVAGIGTKLVTLGLTSLFHVQEIDKQWSAVEKKRVEAANKQAKELQAQFGELGRDLQLAMQEASEPLRSVLDEVRVQARGLADDIGPSLEEGFERARLPLEDFIRDASAGLKDLGDSIPSLMGGFGDVLGEIDIEGFLSDLGEELDELGRVVSENKTVIGAVLDGLLAVIPLAVDGLSKVIGFFGKMGLAVMTSAATIGEHMAGATRVISDVGTGVLNVVRTIGEALSNVPGMEDLGAKIVEGADAGIRKLDEFKKTADEASRAVRLKADIFQLQQDIDKALTALDDPNLTKERRAELSAEVERLLEAKGKAVLELGDPKLIAEYKSAITTEIGTLQSRLADARKELKDPELTKERRSKLNAEIDQLKDAVARAKEALASVKDKTVSIFVKTEYQDELSRQALRDANANAAGDIERYASGGVRAFAAGGRTSPGPHVATGPTILYGEGSDDEAFIPYDSRYRSRAIDLLSQVAEDFGLEVYNGKAAERVSQVSQSISGASTQLGDELGSARTALVDTLGDSGSLTSAIGDVGKVGESLVDGWTAGSAEIGATVGDMGATVSDAVIMMADETTASTHDLMVAVEELGAVVAATAELARGGAGSPKTKGGSDGKGPAGSPKSKGSLLTRPPGGLVEGHYGLDGPEGFTTRGGMSLSGRGGGGTSGGTQYGASGVTVNVDMSNSVVREEPDIDKIGSKVGFNILAQGLA
ncbi:hypothetical protein ITP53_39375 [Nonomuraea sp. K274]|uniref:Uncharacterized protein n=1 Tax=Nonomuraea cypriaca TaxID=1187855 RepID=A0A931AHB0_9ACTN|nr:hypothetical protein [Nonomuraea cypriaca]MBF8191655.1 hypothetical protein [Nonomuraea cypriaca]